MKRTIFVIALILAAPAAYALGRHGPAVSPYLMQQYLASQGYAVGTVKRLELPDGPANIAIAGLQFSADGDWIVVRILPRRVRN